jgi:hypothetical protein
VRPLLAAASAILLVVIAAACEPRTQNTQHRIYCTVMADPPTWNDREHPTRIVSQVRYWCDKPGPSRLALTLHLQKRAAKGGWVDVTRTSFVTAGVATTRSGDTRYQTRSVTAACASGDFRTLVVGNSVARGVTTPYEKTGEQSNPCRTFLTT